VKTKIKLPLVIPDLSGNEKRYLNDCLNSTWISSTGKYLELFEKQFAAFTGTRYALATSNGTTALHLVLAALDVSAGDEVIVPDFTFIATANAVSFVGAKAVLADVDRSSWNINPEEIRKKITHRTCGIIAVHLYGNPAGMGEILEIARERNLWVLEDAAEAHGAEYRINGPKKVGSMGIAGIFSFYGNKIITTGEGGMVTTDDSKLFKKMEILRDHGQKPDRHYFHPKIGFNYRMTNMQAAIGLAQLERINKFLEIRDAISRRYQQQLEGIEGINFVKNHPDKKNVCWLFSMTVDRPYKLSRDRLIELLSKNGIDSRPFFIPINRQPPYFMIGSFEISEYLSGHGINLPTFTTMTFRQIDTVCRIIRKYG